MPHVCLRLGFAVACAALAAACTRAPEPPVKDSTYAMGSIVEFTIAGAPEAETRAAIAEAVDDLNLMHQTFHAWHEGSLGRMNALFPLGGKFTAATSVLPLIQQSTVLSEQSGGLFNPALGKLFALWGWQSDDPPQGPPPRAEQIAEILAQHPRMTDIEIDGVQVRSRNPGVKLDFGAFGQGYAADRIVERFRERGIRNALVNISGDVRAIGRNGDRPWRVGIRHPRGDGILASVLMGEDEALVTSGDYERFFEWEGTRYHHILDPRTGYPARGAISVTVLHASTAVADAAATALLIAGVQDWRATARAMNVRHVLLVDPQLRVHMDPETARRIKFEIDPPPTVVVSESW